MLRMRKQIKWLTCRNLISTLNQHLYIPCLCIWTAWNIHNPVWLNLKKRIKEFRCASTSWRIHDNNICLCIFCILNKEISCVSINKCDILYIVNWSIYLSIWYSFWIKLNSYNFTSLFWGDYSNSTNSAICINYSVFFWYICKLDCLFVQLFSLLVVNLIEWCRAYSEPASPFFHSARARSWLMVEIASWKLPERTWASAFIR